MLYQDPVLFFRGLTIFKDFGDPRTYYYLPPEAPRIARSVEGSDDYALRLVLFRPDPEAPPPIGMEEGGAFLNLDTDLFVPDSLIEEATQEVRRKFGTDANLVPVPFSEGSVELVLLGTSRDDEGQPFVRKVAGSTVPALFGYERAAFSVILDRSGAAVMKAALEEGGATMALAIYHLTYVAIPPAYNLKITIDYKSVYEQLDLRLRAGVDVASGSSSFVAKAGFHLLMEQLKQSRAIKVEVVDPVPGEGGTTPINQEAINEIIGDLMGSKWFKPTLSTSGGMLDLGAAGAGSSGSGNPSGNRPQDSGETGTTGATGATAAAGAGTTPATTPARQSARWDIDGSDDVSGDRGLESFRAASSGTQEALVVRGAGATVRVGATPATLQQQALTGNNLVLDVPAGQTRHVEISWPVQTQVDDSFHLFFAFDRPDASEVARYKDGTPQPDDARFSGASQAKSASSAGGLASLRAWLVARADDVLQLDAYASYESDASAVRHNQELSERRMEVAAQLVERTIPNRFNSSSRRAHGHVTAAVNEVPTITPGGGALDGHGETSRPEHRVAIIKGASQKARPRSVLRGHLTRPAAPTGPQGPGDTPGATGATGPSGKKDDKDKTKLQASFELNLEMIKRDEQITAVYELSTRKARTHQVHPQGQLMFEGDASRYIVEAREVEFFRSLTIAGSTTAQWQSDGIHTIAVQIRYAPRRDGTFQRTEELTLSEAAPTDSVDIGLLHEDEDEERPMVYWYEYKVTVHFTDDVALGDQRGAVTSAGTKDADAQGWIRSEARGLVIHPRDVTPARTVSIATGVLQYDLIERAEIALAYGPYRQNLELSAEHKEHRLVIRPEPRLAQERLKTQGTLYYKDRARVPLPAQEWQPQELVVINEPRENLLRVRTLLADPMGEYERVLVTLRYEHAHRVLENSFELVGHAALQDWVVRLEDPARRAWRYQATSIKRGGNIETIPWTDGDGEQLILGVRAVNVLRIQVNWLVPLAEGDLRAVKVDFEYDDAGTDTHWKRSELIRPGHTGTFEWVVPIRTANARSYRYKVTEFPKLGTPRETPWQSTTEQNLVLLPSF